MASVSKRSNPRPLIHFLGGSVGGFVGLCVGHPFDTLRVRMQTQGVQGVFKNATDCFFKTVSREGARGLYKGISSPLSFYVIQKTFQWGTYGNLHTMLKSRYGSDKLPLRYAFLAGAGAGIVTSFIITPMDRVKILLQVQYPKHLENSSALVEPASSTKFTGALDVVRKLWKTAGIRGLFCGYLPTLFREISGSGTYFYMYEFWKVYFSTEAKPKILLLLLSGGLTGVITWTVCFPFDVVKSRIQSESFHGNTFQIMKKGFQEEGLGVFFRGWRPAMLRAFPVHAAVIVTYDIFMRVAK
eukprot:TRINITY_DN7934_c0_g1_i1.p1 TRINITY_DN7934_c0_g1~~TRINITY_DN7934_c0_g1_i1.p1  ORF type:complete len:317 (-),score=41.40 TRINITY_DN7934_c0_g1_i1:156-1052(-)